jgi:hypothetical protein
MQPTIHIAVSAREYSVTDVALLEPRDCTSQTSGVTAPETRYVRSGDIHIAYQVVGEGPLDLVYIPAGMHHVEHIWDSAPQARFLNRLPRFPACFSSTSAEQSCLTESLEPRRSRRAWTTFARHGRGRFRARVAVRSR